MWIILLDRSNSMGGSFEGDSAFRGRSRVSEQHVKLDAAKIELLTHLEGLGSPTKVAIICFNSVASLIFSGLSTEITEIRAKLNSITPDGGTDIAVALDEIQRYVSGIQGTTLFRTLVISDGLSKLEPARRSANRLVNEVPMSIDVILIDRTDSGEEVARAIAIHGNVSLVTSVAMLAGQIEKSILDYHREAKESGELIKENELSAYNRTSNSVEKLAFTASYPGIVSSGTWYSLLLYLHLVGLEGEIEKLLAARSSQLGMMPSRSTGQIAVPVQRETVFKLVPHLEGFEFNPPTQEIKWYEDIQEISFRLCANASAAGKTTSGHVDVFVGACLIALIPLGVTTRHPHDLSHRETLMATTVERFGSIFISYSNRDAEIIEACAAAYDALGIEVYIDKKRLKSGSKWEKTIQKAIDGSDLFQLYWSEASSKSIYVDQEWRYALELVGQLSKGEHYIRPLRWEDPCPRLPQELSHLHFATLDLKSLFRQKISSKAVAAPLPSMPVPKLQTTVIAALPTISSEQVVNIRENMTQVVEFLERVTQLRYYPIPTILVDDYIVKSIRSTSTIDVPPLKSTLETEISELSDFLGAICLCFHVRQFIPANLDFEHIDESFGLGTILNTEQYQIIRRFCEGGVVSWFKNRWQNAASKIQVIFPNDELTKGFSDFALIVFDRAVELAQKLLFFNVRSINITPTFKEDWDIESLEQIARNNGVSVIHKSYGIELRGRPSEFIALLASIRAIFVKNLPYYDLEYQIRETELKSEHRLCLGAAHFADDILKNLLLLAEDDQSKGIGQILNFHRWIDDFIDPKWQRNYGELSALNIPTITSDLNFSMFVEKFFGIVSSLMESGLQKLDDFEFETRILLSVEAWHKTLNIVPRNDISRLFLDLVPQESSNNEIFYLKGRFSDLTYLFKVVTKHLVDLLKQNSQSTSPLKRFFVSQVATYGIYSPPNSQETDQKLDMWSTNHDIPVELTLPTNAKVLLCLEMQHRLEEPISKDVSFQSDVAQIARLFQLCVLIHEHFHAVLENGLDTIGNTSVSISDPDNWKKAVTLNESLAVWMELHFARQSENSSLQEFVESYIHAGKYPDWMYRGAEYLEKIYQAQGLGTIQTFIDMIRKNPFQAQENFDSLIHNGLSST